MDKSNIDEIKTFVINYLKKLNFSQEESMIFSTLLERGQLTILELSRLAKIERTRIYGITSRLKEIGIIEEIIDYKKKYIKACDFSKLQLIVEKRENDLKFITESLPSLKTYFEFFNSNFHPTQIVLYRGVDGIKQVLWNELSTKTKRIYSFTYRHNAEIVGLKFVRKHSQEYVLRKIKCWDIQSKEFINSFTKKIRPGMYNIESRFIDPKIFPINIAIATYDDIVQIVNWHKGEVFGAEIRNDKFAEFIKQVHKLVWKMGKKGKVR